MTPEEKKYYCTKNCSHCPHEKLVAPQSTLSEDWRERFRGKFHLYKMENPREVMVEHLSGEIEDFIAQIEYEAYEIGKKESFYTKSPVPSREYLASKYAELSLLSKLREKIDEIPKLHVEIRGVNEGVFIPLDEVEKVLSEFEV